MTTVVDLCSSDNEVLDAISRKTSLSLPKRSALDSAAVITGSDRNPLGSSHKKVTPRKGDVLEIDLSDTNLSTALENRRDRSESGFQGTKIDRLTDPMLFTSSPSDDTRKPLRGIAESNFAPKSLIRSFDELGDELPELQQLVQRRPTFSSKTTSILAEISTQRPVKQASRRDLSQKRKRSSEDTKGDSENEDIGSAIARAKRPQRLTSEERELRTAEKERAKEERARAREAEREKRRAEKGLSQEKKRQEKLLKLQEKQKAADLAEINKSKVDKKVTTPEMIVYLPKSIEGKRVDSQARELLTRANAELRTYDSAIQGIVKWQQKVSRDFDEELSHWVRVSRIDDCSFVLSLLSGEQFCNLTCGTNDEGENLAIHLAKIRNKWPNHRIIYCIEGLEAWIKRSKTAQNRAYQAAVRRKEEQAPTQSRRRNQAQIHVDEEAVEDALLELQVAHKCRIQQTLTPVETAEYILSFTQQISLIRHG